MTTTIAVEILAEGKQLPPEVLEPLMQVLRWFLWLVFLSFLARLIWAGGHFAYQRHHALHCGGPAVDVSVTLLAVVAATAASGIAAAILTF